MDSGVVVSRSSPGVALLSAGSSRSRRVCMVPMSRSHWVRPCGPPWRASSRLAAVLSLSTTVASHSSATVSPAPSAWASVVGEYGTSALRG